MVNKPFFHIIRTYWFIEYQGSFLGIQTFRLCIPSDIELCYRLLLSLHSIIAVSVHPSLLNSWTYSQWSKWPKFVSLHWTTKLKSTTLVSWSAKIQSKLKKLWKTVKIEQKLAKKSCFLRFFQLYTTFLKKPIVIYSRVRNKRSPTIIKFLTFFQGLRP